MAEIHTTYAPLANSSNVINYSGQGSKNSPGQNVASGNVPNAVIDDPDNVNGTNSFVIPNQNTNISVSGKTVHGRYNASTVINNPA